MSNVFACQASGQQIFGLNDAEHVVEAALADRKSSSKGRRDLSPILIR